MIEEWRWVPDYEGFYEVSSFGRVRSVDRVRSNGGWLSGRLLKISESTPGVQRVNLSKDGVMRTHRVNRLVMMAFRGPDLSDWLCIHIDGDWTNNRLDNLMLGDVDHIVDGKLSRGTTMRGAKNPAAKLDERAVGVIRASRKTDTVLAKRFGVCQSVISDVRRGASWRDVEVAVLRK